ncbi:MAG: InlB B-repeat-containing protein, partial [Clostridia bacterium]|nr:InlB B-repeat-containing protein [Clostridia bacterium]
MEKEKGLKSGSVEAIFGYAEYAFCDRIIVRNILLLRRGITMNKRLIGGLLIVLLCAVAVSGFGESIALAEEVTAEGLTERASFYTITYDANGGERTPPKQAATPGKAVTVSEQKVYRDLYTFLGWSKSKTATTASYKPGDSITVSGDTTLYAVWERYKALGTITADKTVSMTMKYESSSVWYEFVAGSSGNHMFV